MTITANDPFAGRGPRSEIDRRAIGVFGHLLLAGVWLECQFKNAPRPRISWTQEHRRLPAEVLSLPANVVQINQPRNENR